MKVQLYSVLLEMPVFNSESIEKLDEMMDQYKVMAEHAPQRIYQDQITQLRKGKFPT